MKRFNTVLRTLAVGGLLAHLAAAAQPGLLDPFFATGAGANALVRRVLPLSDGKVLIAGNFTQYDGQACGRIARLNADGSFDATYSSGTGFDGFVLDMELTSTGGVVACGDFLSYDGVGLSGHVIRLNPDGTRDTGFSPPIFGASAINAVEVTPTDGVILTGALGVSSPVMQSRVVKLLSTGAVDASFTTGPAALSGAFLDVEQLSDNRLCVIGSFTLIQGSPRNGICILQANGALDTSFDPGTGPNMQIQDVAIDQNDQAIIAGTFTSYNGGTAGRIARLDPDGTLDGSFDPGAGFNASVQHVLTLPSGAVLCAGLFTSVDDVPVNRFCKLLGDGSIDTGFLIGTGADDAVAVAAVRPDASILIGGLFTSYQGSARGRVARLHDCLPTLWYADTDGDGFGDPATPQLTCPQPTGFVANDDDCDDTDEDLFPIAWFPDADADEYGDPLDSVMACDQPVGYVDNNDDCDDADALIAPDNACDDQDPYTVSDALLAFPDCGCQGVQLTIAAQAFLEGPYDPVAGLMRDDLRNLGLVPLSEPYTALGYVPSSNVFPGNTTADVLTVSGPDAIVDWVVLEVRAGADPSTPVATRYALLQRDGDIVEPDGISSVRFPLPYGFYHLAVLHRNHMGVVAPSNPNGTYFETDTPLDFASPEQTLHAGLEARKNIGGLMCLYMGDVSFNDDLRYTGEGNDRDPILVALGGSTPTNTITGYQQGDTNLDGMVRYTGEQNDRDPTLFNLGGINPNLALPNRYLR